MFRTGYPYRLIYFGNERRSKLHDDFIDWISLQSRQTLDDMMQYIAA